MKLSGQQFAQIQQAFLDAFTEFTLRQMVRVQLDETLEHIAGGENLTELVFNLIRWAEAKESVPALIRAACAANQANPQLRALDKAVATWFKKQRKRSRAVPTRLVESTFPPPPEPVHPPPLDNFIGRARELAYYTDRLHKSGIVALTGWPGVGKTMLTAALAQKVAADPKQIFWHTFYQGEDVRSLLWKLSAFLAYHERSELWVLLNNKNIPDPPLSSLLDYLFQQLKGQNFILCLDDFHLLYDQQQDDPLLQQMVQRLEQAAHAGDVRVIVASRATPQLMKLVTAQPLGGLSEADMAALLRAHQLELPADLQKVLYACTEGNAELLILAIQTLNDNPDSAPLLKRLAAANNINWYLMTQVDEQLDETEKLVMNGVAILLGYPGTGSAIEHAVETSGLRRTLTYLINRYLLTARAGERDQEYWQHTIVREFYYNLLDEPKRTAMHQRTAQYYLEKELDPLRAAQHLLRAGEDERAAELMVNDVYGNLMHGQAARLATCLAEVSSRPLPLPLTIAVKIAEAELYQFQRKSAAAQASSKAALALLANLPTTAPTNQQRVQVYWVLSRVLAGEDPTQALQFVEMGLACLSAEDERRAMFLIHQAALYGMQHKLDLAEQTCLAGIALLTQANLAERANAYLNLGIVRSMQGDLAQGTAHFETALALSQQLGDPFRQLKLRANLSLNKHYMGDWNGALTDMRYAYDLAQRLGDIRHQAQVAANLGDLLRKRGAYNEAQEVLQIGLELGQAAQLPLTIVNAHLNLAQVALAQTQLDVAASHLQTAEHLIDHANLADRRPELYFTQAELQLARGELAIAQQTAAAACVQAQQFGMQAEEAIARRIQAQALSAIGQEEEAIPLLEQSMAYLAQSNRYEYALTQYRLGQTLARLQQHEKAQAHINAARAELTQLGAQQGV